MAKGKRKRKQRKTQGTAPAEPRSDEPQASLDAERDADEDPAETGFLAGLIAEFQLPGSAIALLAVLITVAYVNAYQVPFLFDDAPVITRNRLLWQWSTFDQLILQLPTRALTNLTFLVNFQLANTPTVQDYGFWDTFSYHVVSIALHVLNAALLYLLIRGLLQSRPEVPRKAIPAVALAGSALWAVHPAHTMAVSYIAQRYALLAATAFLGTLVLYVQLRRYTTRHEVSLAGITGRLVAVIGGAGFFAAIFAMAGNLFGALAALVVGGLVGCGLQVLLLHDRREARSAFLLLAVTLATSLCCAVTKENAAVIPLAILLVELCFFRGALFQRAALVGLLFLPFVAGAGIRVAQVGWDRLIPANSPTATQGQYALAQVYVTLRYLHNFFWPTDLTVEQNFPTTWDTQLADTALAGTGHLLLFTLATLLLLRGHRMIPFAIVWYYVTHIVESSIVPILDLMVDHRMYLTTAMIPAAFAVALARAWPHLRQTRVGRLTPVFWGLLVAVSMGGTYLRNRVWSSSTAIWEDTIAKRPDCARAYSSLGMEHLYQGQWLRAVGPIETAVDLGPYHVEGWNNLGKAYLELGEAGFPQAIAALEKGIQINQVSPSNSVPLCWNNLGLIYQRMAEDGDRSVEERIAHLHNSVRHLRQATQIDPDYEVAYVNLAHSEFKLLALLVDDPVQSAKHAENASLAVDHAERVANRRGGRIPFNSHRARTAGLSHLKRFGEAFEHLLRGTSFLTADDLPQALVQERAGMVELAGRVAIEAQLADDPQAEPIMTQAAALFDQQMPQGLIDSLPSLPILRGELAEKLGDAETARRFYQHVLAKFPEHPQAAQIRARLAQLGS